MKKTLQILNGIAAVTMIIMGYLSNTGIFNGKTMAIVSAEYQNLFTPAGYAFSIWGLIYLSLLGFVIYYGRSIFNTSIKDDNTIKEVGWWFVISCLANSLWVIVWLYDYTLVSVILMLLLLFSLLKIVVKTKIKLQKARLEKLLFLFWPFCIYSGWVSVALIANIAAYLTKIGWDGLGFSETFWAIIMIIIAACIHIFMIWKRNMREFALVLIWSLIAIAVANKNENLTVVWSAIIVSCLVFVNIVLHVFLNWRSNPTLNTKS